jgi:hypothetical protein
MTFSPLNCRIPTRLQETWSGISGSLRIPAPGVIDFRQEPPRGRMGVI